MKTPLTILKKYFEFDQVFNLLDYDSRLEDLYTELEKLKKDPFPQDYRFIFTHYDTDYYITNTEPGLLLRNLQRILVELDIPNYFCIIITAQDIESQLEMLQREETHDTVPIASFKCAVQPLLHGLKNSNLELAVDAVAHNYICLNRVTRSHRRLLFSLLKDKNILDKGLVSYGKAQ